MERRKVAELFETTDKRQLQLEIDINEVAKLRADLCAEPEEKEETSMDSGEEPEDLADLQKMAMQELNLWRKAHSKRKPDGTSEASPEDIAQLVADAEALGRGCDEKRRRIERALEAQSQRA